MKKRITFITENLYGGGVERIFQIICNNFDFERFDLTVYSVCRDELKEPFYPHKIRYKYIFDVVKPELNFWQRFWVKLKNKIKLLVYYHSTSDLFYQLFIREKTDVAVAFIEGYATRLVAGFPHKTKRIAWLHIELGNYHWSKVAYRNAEDEQRAYLAMERIVCVANVVKEQLNNLYPVSKKSLVIYNPIDREMILRSAQEILSQELTVKKYINRIISIGSLDARKAHDRILRIAQRLKAEKEDFELWILGKGKKYDELNNYIQENALNDRVKLLGYQTNPYPYLQAADIYVCSSYAEGYNTAITEALILGKAVVSTECSGVREQLGEHNEYGICTPNTEEDLYEGIKQMLRPETLVHYTQKAQERGKDYTLESSMKKIFELFD